MKYDDFKIFKFSTISKKINGVKDGFPRIHKNIKTISDDQLKDEIGKLLKKGMSVKDLSENLASVYGLNKKEVYRLALQL